MIENEVNEWINLKTFDFGSINFVMLQSIGI